MQLNAGLIVNAMRLTMMGCMAMCLCFFFWYMMCTTIAALVSTFFWHTTKFLICWFYCLKLSISIRIISGCVCIAKTWYAFLMSCIEELIGIPKVRLAAMSSWFLLDCSLLDWWDCSLLDWWDCSLLDWWDCSLLDCSLLDCSLPRQALNSSANRLNRIRSSSSRCFFISSISAMYFFRAAGDLLNTSSIVCFFAFGGSGMQYTMYYIYIYIYIYYKISWETDQVCMGMVFSASSLAGHAFISCSNRKQLCALSRKLKWSALSCVGYTMTTRCLGREM